MKVYYCEYFFYLVELLSVKEKSQTENTSLTLQSKESDKPIEEQTQSYKGSHY